MTTTTKSAAHTPGPWRIAANLKEITVNGPGHVPIAELWLNMHPNDERFANAALIAAAPDLLAELRGADTLAAFIDATLASVAVPGGCPDISRAFANIRVALSMQGAKRRAVLAKAEGRTA